MAMEGPIRVWLEPGYDGGRTGSWMLDLPGCFTWGSTRALALARAPSAVARFVRWLDEHGESVERPALDETVVVETVAASVVDGYERNAIYEHDGRPVEEAEVAAALRRLGYAHTDLTGLRPRLSQLEDGKSTRRTRDRADREAEEVIRHVAGAQAWMGSRLDPTAMYKGPGAEDAWAYLSRTADWLGDRLGEQLARDPGLSRTDSKGEEWSLAKLLRRLVYHALDHLDELDRRVALAEGRLDRVRVEHNVRVDPAELSELLRTAGLHRGRRSPQIVARMLVDTRETVSAWDGDRLVGFARAITDGVTNAYISSVAVDPGWQDRGLGGRLIEALIDGREGMKFVLTAREGTEPFYERLGFEPDPRVLVRQRRRPDGGP